MTEKQLLEIQSTYKGLCGPTSIGIIETLLDEVARQADQITKLQQANIEEVERRRKIEGVPMLALRNDDNRYLFEVMVAFPSSAAVGDPNFSEWRLLPRPVKL